MASLGVKRISSKKELVLDDLGTQTADWLRQEIRNFAAQTALQENREQTRIGNIPSRVVIDKRTTIDLTGQDARALADAGDKVTFQGLDSNIRFFYTDTDILKQAVQYCWALLINLTPWDTTTARQSYYLWCSDPNRPFVNKKFDEIGGALSWLDKNQGPLISVRILGPLIEYRRAVIYNPRGRKQQTKLISARKSVNEGATTDRFKFTKPTKSKVDPRKETENIAVKAPRGRKRTYQVQVARAIQEIVVRNAKRQFRDISVKYRFVRSKKLPLPIKSTIKYKWKPKGRNWHIPELSIWAKAQHRPNR